MNIIRQLLIALAMGGGLWTCGHAQEVGLDGKDFAQTVCLQVKFNQGQPAQHLERLKELGVSWVRESVRWETMEPQAGGPVVFPADFQRRLAFYKANNLGVLFVLFGGNALAYPPTKDQPNRWLDPELFARNYALNVAKQLKAAGVAFALQIWNEPHGNAFLLRPFYGGTWNGEAGSPWVREYVRLVNTVVNEIKAHDPGITLLSNDDMWHLHYRFMEEGITSRLDGFAVHPYTPMPPETVAVNPHNAAWTRPFVVTDPQRSFAASVAMLKAAAAARWDKSPEIWVSEWGWAVGGKAGNGEPLAEETVAAYLPRAFVQALSAGVKRTCWFSMQDRNDGPMGLLRNDGVERMAYGTMRAMSRELSGLRWQRQLLGQATPTSGVQAHLFVGDGVQKVVLWVADGAATPFAWPTGWGVKAVVNMHGETVKPESMLGMKLDEAPVYVQLTAVPE